MKEEDVGGKLEMSVSHRPIHPQFHPDGPKGVKVIYPARNAVRQVARPYTTGKANMAEHWSAGTKESSKRQGLTGKGIANAKLHENG